MRLKDGMILFHGSYAAVENIDLSKCMHGKDFGRGFYLTANPSQARNFIRSSLIKAQNYGLIPINQDYGYVSSFRYHHSQSIQIHEFSDADKDWLWFISINRRHKLASVLKPHIDESILKSDIIIGKIANDTTNPVITTYLNGLYGDVQSDRAVSIAIDQLMPNHLDSQYCFLSDKAICCLESLEVRKYVI